MKFKNKILQILMSINVDVYISLTDDSYVIDYDNTLQKVIFRSATAGSNGRRFVDLRKSNRRELLLNNQNIIIYDDITKKLYLIPFNDIADNSTVCLGKTYEHYRIDDVDDVDVDDDDDVEENRKTVGNREISKEDIKKALSKSLNDKDIDDKENVMKIFDA